MVERTWRLFGMDFCLMVVPQLVPEVFNDQKPVLPATMFNMSRAPHPTPSSTLILFLFDAQMNLRLQSFYTLLVLWAARSSFQKLLRVTADAHNGDYSDYSVSRVGNYSEDDKDGFRYRSHILPCFDAEVEICQALEKKGA